MAALLAASLLTSLAAAHPSAATLLSTVSKGLGTLEKRGEDVAEADAASMEETSSCKIFMLWNWTTIDACFLSEHWQIKSGGGFAVACLVAALLVIGLEVLRRAAKEFDRFLIKRHYARTTPSSPGAKGSISSDVPGTVGTSADMRPFRPKIYQQLLRALLHTLQFAAAYLVMLMAMYYNGYILASICLGAFLGSFIFQWEPLGPNGQVPTSGAQESTVCCG